MRTLNEVYSSLSTRRRYEVWFVRFGVADGAGAWWFRYLLTNPGRNGCSADSRGMPVQVWATWFPRDATPQTFIQGYSLKDLELSRPGDSDFYFRVGKNEIKQNSCKGLLQVEGHEIAWDLEFRSTFRVTMSNKGWIGFSRTPHSNARFSGEVCLDRERATGDPLGFGLQGHNCGYRHRGFWNWAHVYFLRPNGAATTFEALTYDMPFGLMFRKAVLWHEGNRYVFRKFIIESRTGERHFTYPAGTSLSTGITGSTIHRAMVPRIDWPTGVRSAASTAAIFAGREAPWGRKSQSLARSRSSGSCQGVPSEIESASMGSHLSGLYALGDFSSADQRGLTQIRKI